MNRFFKNFQFEPYRVHCFHLSVSLLSLYRDTGSAGGEGQLTLSEPGGKIIPNTLLLAPPPLRTFRPSDTPAILVEGFPYDHVGGEIRETTSRRELIFTDMTTTTRATPTWDQKVSLKSCSFYEITNYTKGSNILWIQYTGIPTSAWSI